MVRLIVLPLAIALSALFLVGCAGTRESKRYRVIPPPGEGMGAEIQEGESAVQAFPGGKNEMRNWRQIQLGMTEQNIIDLLGTPDSRLVHGSGAEMWSYRCDGYRSGSVNISRVGKCEGYNEP